MRSPLQPPPGCEPTQQGLYTYSASSHPRSSSESPAEGWFEGAVISGVKAIGPYRFNVLIYFRVSHSCSGKGRITRIENRAVVGFPGAGAGAGRRDGYL